MRTKLLWAACEVPASTSADKYFASDWKVRLYTRHHHQLALAAQLQQQ